MAFSLTYVDRVGSGAPGSEPATFSSVPLGADVSSPSVRYSVLHIGWQDGAVFTLGGVTIGGAAATILGQINNSLTSVALVIADTTGLGTSADVVVDTVEVGVPDAMSIGSYRLVDPDSATPHDTATAVHSSGVVTLSVDIPTGGAATASAYIRNNSAAGATWSGLTEDFDLDINANDYHTGALGSTAGTPRVITVTSSDTTPQGMVGVSASWAPAAGGGDTTDDLLANDVSSGTPTVGTPALGQIHVIAANDVSAGTPSVGSPVLGQQHALTADDVATGAPSLTSPVLGVVHNLAANDVATGSPSVGSPAIGQVHVITADDVATGSPSVSAPAIGQVHVLAGDDVSSGTPSVGAPVLADIGSSVNVLLADDVSAGVPSVSSPALGQVHVLAANDVSSGVPSVDSPTLDRPVNTDRGGDGFPVRERRKYRHVTAKRLKELLDAPEQEIVPSPTHKRVRAVRREIMTAMEGGGLLGPVRQEVARFVAAEVAEHYQPEMDWRALANAMQAVMQRAAEEAERIEREIEDEDEFVIMMAA